MRLRIYAYIIALIGLVFHGCNNGNKNDEQSWLTEEPLTIPYRTRIQRFEKGNLVRNYSLEHGKTYKVDSTHSSFSLDGWQQFGNDIEWVDLANNHFKSDEVYSGSRAIKIVRTTASETDVHGSGIQSDFIKIIPGNYQLTLALRIQDVYPQSPAVGIKMNDAIDIRLLYYDRSKNPIRPVYQYPLENQQVDVSFKALSFAHFRFIDSISWCRITGKSHAFPFPEGDIPTKAQFVKISIGLKGAGTIWVDDIDFRYTDKNFTVHEHMLSYTDTSYITQNAFIPTPKRVKNMEAVYLLKPDMHAEELPVILIPESFNETGMKAALLLQDALQKMINRYFGPDKGYSINMIQRLSDEVNHASLIISLGNTSLFQKYSHILPVPSIRKYQDGYFIYTPHDAQKIVLLGANNPKGIYYAALTVLQMFDRKEPVFHNAQIIDYPDFPFRLYAIEGYNFDSDLIEELIRYKYNGAVLLKDTIDNKFFQRAENEQDMVRFFSASGYMLPDDSILRYPYPLYFRNTTGITNGFQFPQFFNNQMINNSDIPDRTEAISGNNKLFIYTGSSYFSVNTDAVDIQKFISLYGSSPVFMDNSMRMATSWGRYNGNESFYPGKLRLFNLFEPYGNEGIRYHFALLDSTYFIVNLPALSEIEIIRLATAADFLWNGSSYSKHYALWKVLVSRYGIENARILIEYADTYALLLETLSKLNSKIQVTRNIKNGQTYITDLTSILARISDNLGIHHRLVKNLQVLNAQLRVELNKNQSIIPVKK